MLINFQKLFENKANKSLFKNISGSFFVKGGAVVVALFTMPAYIKFFPDQIVLGVWFTVISILNWILSFDLGIGNGLRNNLVKAFSEDNEKEIKKYISSAYIILGAISLTIGFIGYFCLGVVNWNEWLNVSTTAISSIHFTMVMRILFVGIMIQFFLAIIQSILYSMQRTILPSVLALISTITLLTFMSFYKNTNMQESIVVLAWVNVLAINVPLLITTIILFSTKLKKSIPSFNFYVNEYAYKIIRLGGKFFIIQVLLVIINSTNLLLITWIYGVENVVEYQVYFKLFSLFFVLFALISNPVWSAVTKAAVEGRYIWIEKVYYYFQIKYH